MSTTTPWNVRAYRELMRWVYFNRGQTFVTSALVDYLADRIERPEEPRAWGGVIGRAKDEGLIEACGQAKNSRRGAWVTVWRAR